MEHFFHRYAHWLRHHVHKLKRSVSHHEMFHSKNTRLAIILIIAAAIPLTVLAVQQVQEIRQQAATAKAACDGTSTGLLVEPRPAIKDKKIVFKHTEVNDLPPIDERSFQEWDSLGNGVYPDSDEAKKCKRVGDTIECIARGSAKPGQISKHTWKFRELALCEYEVKNDTPKPTKGPPKPTSTPKPNAGFDADLEADGCNANQVARLKVKWDATSGKTCKITLEGGGQKEERTTCNAESLTYDALPRGSSNDLKSKTTYILKVSVDGKERSKNATTAECVKTDKTPTPTLRPGQATPTPVPGSKTCTKIDVHLDKAGTSCTTGGKIRLTGGWEISGTNCKVTLYEDGKAISNADVCKNTAWFTSNDIKAGKKYQLKATSDICTTQKLESDTVTAKACADIGSLPKCGSKEANPQTTNQGQSASAIPPFCSNNGERIACDKCPK